MGINRPFHKFGGRVEEITKLVCRKLGVENFSTISTFKRPDHRREHVATIRGIAYINDSKATNVGAALYALEHVSGPCVIILGGQTKGHSFEELSRGIKKETQVVAYGEAREKIANALQPNRLVHVVETLKSAVEKAESLASRGATVLFSPACASFDSFRNYEERGAAFKQYVRRSTT
jgi:UDP-N-acetylmuramoylalanine--D-glutamate ligase